MANNKLINIQGSISKNNGTSFTKEEEQGLLASLIDLIEKKGCFFGGGINNEN